MVFLIIVTEIIFSGERPKSNFADYAEAKTSGIMGRGWIPTFIPESATDIKEQHDLDTNWVEMTFNYTPSDTQDTRSACDNETKIDTGIELQCKYPGSNDLIKLYDNGTANLYGF